jgi:Cu/Zn superoxide dismutase
MKFSTKRASALLVIAAFALLAVACGDDDDSSDGSDEPETTMGEMSDDDMEAMNMGDANATAAADTEYDTLVSGDLVLLDTRSEGHDEVAGSITMARRSDGTTVTAEVSGLIPGDDYISHVHDGPCDDAGGNHYKFDPNGSDVPPNEIHLAFTADEDGNGFMTAENHGIASDDAIAFVVHPKELLDNKIACAEFEDA